jgi:hypothetical protein
VLTVVCAISAEDVGGWLSEAGGIVGGAATLAGTMSWVVARLLADSGADLVDPGAWARRGGQVGGAFGFVVLLWQVTGP